MSDDNEKEVLHPLEIILLSFLIFPLVSFQFLTDPDLEISIVAGLFELNLFVKIHPLVDFPVNICILVMSKGSCSLS